MDFALTDEQKADARNGKGNFARKRLPQRWKKTKRNTSSKKEIVEGKLGDFFGFLRIALRLKSTAEMKPELQAACVMTEEVAKVSPSWGYPSNLQIDSIQSVSSEFRIRGPARTFPPK